MGQKETQRLLNKLTMDNFARLLPQFHALPLGEVGGLQTIIDCIYGKAIDEPAYQSLVRFFFRPPFLC